MPQRNSPARATVTRLALFAVVGWALVALARRHDEEAGAAEPANSHAHRLEPMAERTVEASRPRPRSRRQRIATSLAFTTLFFAGAAFSAGAGDVLVQAVENDCDTPVAEMTAETAAACEAQAAEAEAEAGASEEPVTEEEPVIEEDPATEEEPADTGTDDGAAEEADAGDPADDVEGESEDGATDEESGAEESEPPAEDGEEPAEGGADEESTDGGESEGESNETRPEPVGEPVLELEDESHEHDLDPEASASGSVATVWLHRTLPDPTPVARRLMPAFAKQLQAASRQAGVDWAVVLASLRAEGRKGRAPADRAALRERARDLRTLLRSHDEWQAFLALRGRTAFADRATALVAYNRAVGLRALVTGLEAAKPALEQKVLADGRLDIYGGGRSDVASGGIDVRVLVLLRYLAEQHGQVTVSSLHTGHRLYSRPGVVSAHVYGLAVDIAALGGRSILGNSAPGGITEEAVRDILLLPVELRPKQVISLLGLGGPSFPQVDHADHIHIGY